MNDNSCKRIVQADERQASNSAYLSNPSCPIVCHANQQTKSNAIELRAAHCNRDNRRERQALYRDIVSRGSTLEIAQPIVQHRRKQVRNLPNSNRAKQSNRLFERSHYRGICRCGLANFLFGLRLRTTT
jgi:hypothetical protein